MKQKAGNQGVGDQSAVDLSIMETFTITAKLRQAGASSTVMQMQQPVIRDGMTGGLHTHLDVGRQVCADVDGQGEDSATSSGEEDGSSDDDDSDDGHGVDLSNQNAYGRGGKKVSNALLKQQKRGQQRDSHFVSQLRRKVQKMNRRIAKEDDRKRALLQQKRLKERDEHLRKHCSYHQD